MMCMQVEPFKIGIANEYQVHELGMNNEEK